jgi:hypothetical protein
MYLKKEYILPTIFQFKYKSTLIPQHFYDITIKEADDEFS